MVDVHVVLPLVLFQIQHPSLISNRIAVHLRFIGTSRGTELKSFSLSVSAALVNPTNWCLSSFLSKNEDFEVMNLNNDVKSDYDQS